MVWWYWCFSCFCSCGRGSDAEYFSLYERLHLLDELFLGKLSGLVQLFDGKREAVVEAEQDSHLKSAHCDRVRSLQVVESDVRIAYVMHPRELAATVALVVEAFELWQFTSIFIFISIKHKIKNKIEKASLKLLFERSFRAPEAKRKQADWSDWAAKTLANFSLRSSLMFMSVNIWWTFLVNKEPHTFYMHAK